MAYLWQQEVSGMAGKPGAGQMFDSVLVVETQSVASAETAPVTGRGSGLPRWEEGRK